MPGSPAAGRNEFSRRTLFELAVGAAGVAALSGCSTQGGDYTRCPAPSADTAGSTGTDLGELSGVSVGDAVLRGEGCDAVIVARPPDGTVTAFHAVCPHRQIVVERDGGQWRCPAHGARFDTLTGAVLKGPASSPLPPVDVQVVNGRVVTRS